MSEPQCSRYYPLHSGQQTTVITSLSHQFVYTLLDLFERVRLRRQSGPEAVCSHYTMSSSPATHAVTYMSSHICVHVGRPSHTYSVQTVILHSGHLFSTQLRVCLTATWGRACNGMHLHPIYMVIWTLL